MDSAETEHISLLIEDALSDAEAAMTAQNQALLRKQSAAGMLRSGNTLHQSLGILRSISENFLMTVAEKVASARKTPDDFSKLESGVERCLDFCFTKFQTTIALAVPAGEAALQAESLRLFDEMRGDLARKLAIHKFAYQSGGKHLHSPSHADHRADVDEHTLVGSNGQLPERRKNPGGRPPAAFWDQLWVEIAAQLYDGSLKPKRQSHIEDAMKRWLAEQGHDSADSTVRERARRLWNRLNLPEA